MKKKFSELVTGQYFRTIHEPHIWSDGWILYKNEFLAEHYNAYVFYGPVNYNGINLTVGDDEIVEHLHISEISVPNGMLERVKVENDRFDLRFTYQ